MYWTGHHGALFLDTFRSSNLRELALNVDGSETVGAADVINPSLLEAGKQTNLFETECATYARMSI